MNYPYSIVHVNWWCESSPHHHIIT